MWEKLISLVGKNAIAAADFSKQGGPSFLEARAKKGDAKEVRTCIFLHFSEYLVYFLPLN